MTSTESQKAEWARLAEASTPGPWAAHDFGYPGQDEPSSIVIHTGKFDWDDIREGTSLIASTDWDAQPSADANFIAAAREAVPALLADYEELSLAYEKMARDASDESERLYYANKEIETLRRKLAEKE